MNPNLIRVEKLTTAQEASRMGCPPLNVFKRQYGYGVFYATPHVYGFRERFTFTKREATAVAKAWANELMEAGKWTTATTTWTMVVRGEIVYFGRPGENAAAALATYQALNPTAFVLVEYASR